MIFRFIKPWEEACKDYLQGIEKPYNREIILESLRQCGKLESESFKIKLTYRGNKEVIKIERKEKQ